MKEVGNFSQDDLIKSPMFQELRLTVSEVFQPTS